MYSSLPAELWIEIGKQLSAWSTQFQRDQLILEPLDDTHPDPSVVQLSCTCQWLRSIFREQIRSNLILHLDLYENPHRIVHCRNIPDNVETVPRGSADSSQVPLEGIPIGPHIRRLVIHFRLFPFDESKRHVDHWKQMHMVATDLAVDVVRRLPNVQSIALLAHHWPDMERAGAPISSLFGFALSKLIQLKYLYTDQCILSEYCPALKQVTHLRTDGYNYSIPNPSHFPLLTDLKNGHVGLFDDTYQVPMEILQNLRVLHWHPSCTYMVDSMVEQLLSVDPPPLLPLVELYIDGHVIYDEVVGIIKLLGNADLRVFGCVSWTDDEKRGDLRALVYKTWPKLTHFVPPVGLNEYVEFILDATVIRPEAMRFLPSPAIIV